MPALEADYVIAGGGSAGCVLAARLSEDPATSVLLLEAGGGDGGLGVAVPAAFSKLFHTRRDWAFFTEPEPHLEGRRLYVPRGRMLGGSSSMNAMIYIRGHRADYDGWRDAGCAGWSYDELLPSFLRAEDQARGASEHHGVGGPLRVSDLRSVNPLSTAFVDAARAAGLEANDDFNGARQSGVGLYQVTQRRGRRWSAASAYLAPARRRRNLTVLTGARAHRVSIESGRAVGVELRRRRGARRGDGIERVRARREVIVSAGAIQSPQLLWLSGLGPAADLERLGIDVAVDLPGVGEGLQDHPFTGVVHRSLVPVCLDGVETLGNLAVWALTRRGPLTSIVAEAGGFVRTRPGLAAPDLQFHFAPAHFVDHGFRNPAGHGFSLGATLVASESRGRVSLRSADPEAPPRIEGRFLSQRGEWATLRAGIRLAREIAAQRPFDRFRGEELLPGPSRRSDAELDDFIRQSAEVLYHPVGTCAMGTGEAAVVDPELRVRGVEGLRVVDASVMPRIVRGNTNAPTIAIAERGAELIRRG